MPEDNQSHHQEPEANQSGQFRPRDSGKGQSPERKGTEGHHGPDERHYTLSITEEDRQRSFEIEDERWERNHQIGDWVKLFVVVLIYLGVTFVVYFLQPGIR